MRDNLAQAAKAWFGRSPCTGLKSPILDAVTFLHACSASTSRNSTPNARFATMANITNQFATLPTEMAANVVAYIRDTASMCSICLVSREWRDIMAPSLFRTLYTSVRPRSAHGMTALIHPSSEILKHVRELIISTTATGDKQHSNDDLHLLLAAIPRDQLLCFTYEGSEPLPLSTLQLLLQCHGELKALRAIGVHELVL